MPDYHQFKNNTKIVNETTYYCSLGGKQVLFFQLVGTQAEKGWEPLLHCNLFCLGPLSLSFGFDFFIVISTIHFLSSWVCLCTRVRIKGFQFRAGKNFERKSSKDGISNVKVRQAFLQ